jgi:uncharacterized membrane protein
MAPREQALAPPLHEQPTLHHLVSELRHTSYNGPLPSPHALQAYEAVLPGVASAIVDSFKAETAHRHAIEKLFAAAQIEGAAEDRIATRRGQIIVLIITIAVLAVALYGVYRGQDFTGAAALLGAVALVWRTTRAREEKARREAGGGDEPGDGAVAP